MSKEQGRAKAVRPIGLVLPAVVIVIGLTAIVMGIPKETRALSLLSTGVPAMGHVSEIEHSNKTTVLVLTFSVHGNDHTVSYSLPDADFEKLPPGHEFKLVYLESNPTVATADLAKDRKIALGYLVAGFLDLLVGFLVLRAALLQRAQALQPKSSRKRQA